MSNADSSKNEQPVMAAAANPFAANPFADDAEIIEAELCNSPLPPHLLLPRQSPSEPTFHVPTRFGMSAILGITTALACLFGMLRWLNAPAVSYLFFGLLAMVICLVQMRYGDLPRQASVIAGAVLMQVFTIGVAIFGQYEERESIFCFIVGSIPMGGFLGYLMGTCAGGIFLLMDLFEKHWTQRTAASRLDAPEEHG